MPPVIAVTVPESLRAATEGGLGNVDLPRLALEASVEKQSARKKCLTSTPTF